MNSSNIDSSNLNSDKPRPVLGDILIIDDVPDNLRFLSELLTKAGYTVRKVTNGEMGIESAVLEPPDLILLDIKMPGISGYQVCDRLKNSDRTHQIPIIFLSALDEEAEKVMAFQAGGVDYILKPFQVVEVLARIETHLRISRLQQQLQQKNSQLEREAEQRNTAESALKLMNQNLEMQIQNRISEFQKENQKLLSLQTELQKILIREQQQNRLKSQWVDTIVQTFHSPLLEITSVVEQIQETATLKRTETRTESGIQNVFDRSDHLTDSNSYMIHEDQFKVLITNTQLMNQSLQDVLLLLNAETQKIAFHPTRLNLTEFCRSLINQWQHSLDPTYRLLFVNFGTPPDGVIVDETLLHQFCTHLLDNAVRYSPKGGSILFELIYKPTELNIHIRDEGIGVAPDEQDRIFDRFYRGKNADRVAGTGAGLGLAVVKQAVELHGGIVTVSSEVDRGSTFTVSLPIKTQR